MDFWSRLIGGGGGGASPSTKQAHFNDPQQRFAQFTKIYSQLLRLWHKHDPLSSDPIASDNARICIERMTKTLDDEAHASAPQPCISYVNTNQVYIAISQVATSSANEGIVHQVLRFFGALIESDEGEFLADSRFARAWVQFIESLMTQEVLMIRGHIEAEALELLFAIAAQIRLRPEILPTWFKPTHDLSPRDGSVIEVIPHTSHDDFPLFYLLLNYIRHEGRAGDFARTGLLYIIESTVHSESLERWIIESELATLMASGIGALYSQLSQRLRYSFANNERPRILVFSEAPLSPKTMSVEDTSSPEVQAHLGTFLSYLVFWQDTLEHCASSEVKETLLEHFQSLFLRQLLYPSLLESSDFDGGSSVAVLTYLKCILETISHPDLVHLILQFLLALPDRTPESAQPVRPTTLARRRKSQDLLTHQTHEERPSPTLFTLADLILTSLRSANQGTIAATLRLLSVILHRQHNHAGSKLVKTRILGSDYLAPTIGRHNTQISVLLALADDIVADDDVETSYQMHLCDNRDRLESHPCSRQFLNLPSQRDLHSRPGLAMKDDSRRIVALEDPLLGSLLSLLETFFTNNVETNLSLTQSIVDLASCACISLEGWLVFNPADFQSHQDDIQSLKPASHPGTIPGNEPLKRDFPFRCDEEVSSFRFRGLELARQEPQWNAQDSSPIVKALDSLVQQVRAYRQEIQDFDRYLGEQKHIFRVGEEPEESIHPERSHIQRHVESKRSSPTTPGKAPQSILLFEHTTPQDGEGEFLESNSPQGRLQDPLQVPLLAGKLSHSQTTSSPSRSRESSRTHSSSSLRCDPVLSAPLDGLAFDPLRRKVRVIPNDAAHLANAGTVGPQGNTETNLWGTSTEGGGRNIEGSELVCLGKLLTNTMILQEFVLELAALIETRAGLFEEVRFI